MSRLSGLFKRMAEGSAHGVEGPSRIHLFLSASAFDFALVLIVSVCLSMTVSYGFENGVGLKSNPLACTAIVAPLAAILFAGSWSKRALAPAGVLAAMWSIGVITVFTTISASTQLFVNGSVNDSADSNFIFGIVACIVLILVYVLSRRRLGVIVLLFAYVIATEMIQFCIAIGRRCRMVRSFLPSDLLLFLRSWCIRDTDRVYTQLTA